MFSIFILSPILLLATFVVSATILCPNHLQECFIFVKTSPLGAMVIAAYFMVLHQENALCPQDILGWLKVL